MDFLAWPTIEDDEWPIGPANEDEPMRGAFVEDDEWPIGD